MASKLPVFGRAYLKALTVIYENVGFRHRVGFVRRGNIYSIILIGRC